MLSDEEIQAMEILKSCGIKCNGLDIYKILLNLIHRYSEEIEELKEKNRQGKMRIVQLENEITARIEDVNKYFTPNDKIKAILENETINISGFECVAKGDVQSLLEKE